MRNADIIQYIGSGSYKQGKRLFEEIRERLIHARSKHDWHGYKPKDAMKAIADEVAELKAAVEGESPELQHDEALDVAATVIRFLLREWER